MSRPGELVRRQRFLISKQPARDGRIAHTSGGVAHLDLTPTGTPFGIVALTPLPAPTEPFH